MGGQRKTAAPPAATQNAEPPRIAPHPVTPPSPIPLLSQAGTLNFRPPPARSRTTPPAHTNRLALRLSNTTTPLGELQRSDTAILLENALLDTARPAPADPRSSARPGRSGQLHRAGPRAD